MRRGIGFTLICLGLFLAVLGGTIRYWAYDRLVVVPIDLYNTLDLPGKATYLDMTTVKEKTANVVARQTIRADVDASSDRVLVADLSQVISTADGQFIRASVERAAIDRRTGAAVNCCDEMVDEKPARHDGYLFKLPFNTPKRDLMIWDSTTASANPARYAGTETIAGHVVQKYVTQVPGRQIRTQADSGLLVGESRTFDAPVWNESTKTLWVEPVTGTPLAVELQTTTTLRNSRGQDKVTVFAATLRTDRANPSPEMLALVDENKRKIELVGQAPPLALGAGATLAALGVALLLWRRPAPRTARHAPVSPAVPAGPPALPPGRPTPDHAHTSYPTPEHAAAGHAAPRVGSGQAAEGAWPEVARGAAERRRSGRHATGEFAVPAALRQTEPPTSRPPHGLQPSPGPHDPQPPHAAAPNGAAPREAAPREAAPREAAPHALHGAQPPREPQPPHAPHGAQAPREPQAQARTEPFRADGRPSWDDLGPGRPVSPAPVADRPLSRYIRPYLDGDTGSHPRPDLSGGDTGTHRLPDLDSTTGSHRRPDLNGDTGTHRRPDIGTDPVSERTGSHRAPDFDEDTGTHRRPEPRSGGRAARRAADPDDDWFAQIRPDGLGNHGRLDPADWSHASTSDGPGRDRSLTDLLSADRGATDAPPPAVPPRRRRRRYPDGW
ncbi:porin PorA family protein [Cryptosporangium aurantiacum]|uniref:DUF3068 domain-containing protein n=1 Tax=Cryptosporangium aurantiacum TaxID=134849 RepID=A0A1M7N1Z3_9ACTN|nr:porin PorA family protein [Cryptosporangium aurantiacum]SHM97519.1 Protein of unknown function [Cryptosporangium aurantiacum]